MHKSHQIRINYDGTIICINCNARDEEFLGTWGTLVSPCISSSKEYNDEIDEAQEDIDNDLVEKACRIHHETTAQRASYRGMEAVLKHYGVI